MKNNDSGKSRKNWKLLLGCFWIIGAFVACAATQQAAHEKKDQPKGKMLISSITASKGQDGETVALKSEDHLVFTSIKQPSPASVIVYLQDTRFEGVIGGVLPDFEVIEEIKADVSPDESDTTRVEIRIKKDVLYEVTQDSGGLLVNFSKDSIAVTSPPPVIASETLPAAEVPDAAVSRKDKPADTVAKEPVRLKAVTPLSGSEVQILAEGQISSYSTFTLEDPPRIVVDVFNLTNRPLKKEKVINVRSEWMKRVRYYGDEEKLRVVIDTQKVFLTRYQATPSEKGLNILIASAPAAVEETPVVAEVKAPKAEETDSAESKPVQLKPQTSGKNAPAGKVASAVTDPIGTSGVYTGEKIALDFFDTDIRNVFRILGEVSQKNFAVDKDVEGRVSLQLSDPVPWDQVLDLVLKMNQLEKQVQDNVIRIATFKSLQAEQDARSKAMVAEKKRKAAETFRTEYIQVNYANAETEVFPHIARFFNTNQAEKEGASRVSDMIQDQESIIPGTVSVDSRNNVIIITSIPEMIERAKEIVRKVDRVTPQVMIEARIVEANTNFSRQIGIDWSSQTGIGPYGVDPRAGIGPQRGFDRWEGTYGYDSAISLPVTGAPAFGFNFTKLIGSPFLLDAQLSALEENGEGKIISSPRVMTLNNREAEIKQGLEIGYQTVETVDGVDKYTIKFKNVDLILKVTPQVTLDKRVSLSIHVTKNELAGYYDSGIGQIPLISTKEANTALLVDDGETIAIGGIAVNTILNIDTGVPWLNKVPLLGWLFKQSSDVNEKRELLIFMTPQINQLEQRMPAADGKDVSAQKQF